jgi:hypothetical protein
MQLHATYRYIHTICSRTPARRTISSWWRHWSQIQRPHQSFNQPAPNILGWSRPFQAVSSYVYIYIPGIPYIYIRNYPELWNSWNKSIHKHTHIRCRFFRTEQIQAHYPSLSHEIDSIEILEIFYDLPESKFDDFENSARLWSLQMMSWRTPWRSSCQCLWQQGAWWCMLSRSDVYAIY